MTWNQLTGREIIDPLVFRPGEITGVPLVRMIQVRALRGRGCLLALRAAACEDVSIQRASERLLVFSDVISRLLFLSAWLPPS